MLIITAKVVFKNGGLVEKVNGLPNISEKLQ